MGKSMVEEREGLDGSDGRMGLLVAGGGRLGRKRKKMKRLDREIYS